MKPTPMELKNVQRAHTSLDSQAPEESDSAHKEQDNVNTLSVDSINSATHVQYRLYKRRFFGLSGFVVLNIVAGMTWPWFGPISNNMVTEFGITLDEVNWLGNIESCIYLPVAILVPIVCSRYGIRRCCDIATVALLLSAWIRYAGTARSLPTRGAYALLILGQFFASIAQPVYQILGPKYSEVWFDLNGRTTATMVIAIANPIGSALGQLISPLVGSTRTSILVLGIISTAVVPFNFLIGSAPPSPPTYAGSKKSPPIMSLLRAMIGKKTSRDAYMTRRERLDFFILTMLFGVLVAATNTFGILTNEILGPAGYSSDLSGIMGACLLLSGIVAAIVTAPLFDRVFTHHLAITIKLIVPILAGTWLSLIWAVKPNDTAGLFVIMVLLGVTGVTILPVALELGCELTRNADGSSAILWFSDNVFSIIFVLVQGALRAGKDATPPLNMRNSLIFNAVFVMVFSSTVFLIRGHQKRKELDEAKKAQQTTSELPPRVDHNDAQEA